VRDPNGSTGPYDLPEGWRWSDIAGTSSIGSKQVFPKDLPAANYNYVALENIEQGSGRLVDFTTTEGSEIGSNKYTFGPEHVLFGKLRPYLRKVLVPDFMGISATDLLPIRPDPAKLDRDFLARWLLSPYVLEYVVSHQTGVKMPRLRTGDLKAMPIPLPPLPEQERIVEKIERLLAQSLTAREALDRIPPLLKRFRQSVLSKAFSGELAEHDPNDEPASVLLERIREERRRIWGEDMRARGKDPYKAKYVEPELPDTRGLSELPEGWVWVSVDQLAEVGTGATPLRTKRKEYYEGGTIPWITSGALNIDPIVEPKEFITELAIEETNAKLFPKGTLLVAMYGEGQTRGRVSELGIDAATNQACAAMLFSGAASVCKAFVKYYFKKTYEDIRLLSAGGVQPNLNLTLVRRTSVPLAPLGEQHRIVARIESSFAQVVCIERPLVRAIGQAKAVDQALLARAFRGDL
jgi:type I restriction enzyme S subunit